MSARYPIPAARHQTVSVVLRSRFIAVADRADALVDALREATAGQAGITLLD